MLEKNKKYKVESYNEWCGYEAKISDLSIPELSWHLSASERVLIQEKCDSKGCHICFLDSVFNENDERCVYIDSSETLSNVHFARLADRIQFASRIFQKVKDETMSEEMTSENMMPEVAEAEAVAEKAKKKKPVQKDKLSPKDKAVLIDSIEKMIKNEKKQQALHEESIKLSNDIKALVKTDNYDYQTLLLKVLKMV